LKQTAPLEIGLSVIDLPLMQAFYTDVFGCKEIRRADIPAQLSQGIRVTANGYENVWMQFPGGEIVKLVRPKDTPVPAVTQEYSADITGLSYFSLYCDDIGGAITRAESAGATLISDAGLAAENPVRLAFLTDPEGNVFEFVQA
jgi:catechol 2,3-dioxygenase-like lactoylglutathione lyase family enzyme